VTIKVRSWGSAAKPHDVDFLILILQKRTVKFNLRMDKVVSNVIS